MNNVYKGKILNAFEKSDLLGLLCYYWLNLFLGQKLSRDVLQI